MQKSGIETVRHSNTSDQMSLYLAKGRSERSKAFHEAFKGVGSWFSSR